MVMGWFTLLEGVLEGAINPSLVTVVDHIRKGTLDFVLIKPADAQFLVSTARFQPVARHEPPGRDRNFPRGAFAARTRSDRGARCRLAAVTLVAAIAVLYSLWLLTVSAAFFVVRIDNLTHLFSAIFDAARWPVSVFRGVVRLLLTFVVPLALMTTYPAQALLGTLRPGTLVATIGGALLALGYRARCGR